MGPELPRQLQLVFGGHLVLAGTVGAGAVIVVVVVGARAAANTMPRPATRSVEGRRLLAQASESLYVHGGRTRRSAPSVCVAQPQQSRAEP
jgi:hypothetical protein